MAFPYLVTLSLLAAAALAGCSEEPLPEVSQENCTFPQMMQIKDQARREDFKSFCSYIPDSAWPIHPDKWLKLSEAEREKFQEASTRIRPTPNPINWLSKGLGGD